MILADFMNMWTRANRSVIICDSKCSDDCFDDVDDLNDGKARIQDFNNYIEFAFIPHYSQFNSKYYLHPKFAFAEVTEFFIGDTYIIVWLDLKDKFGKEQET
jgi:hypothetical protein